METMKDKPQIIQDMIHAIENDEWMWIVCWGEPRCGKSSLSLLITYQIYQDWDKVLNSVVFNLGQVIYKIERGLPELWPTKNLLHDRIPILLWDDFGAYSNKAITQYDRAWDIFKGAFDTLGTKISILLANMVSPFSPTQQLQTKFTHELWIPWRGHVKYDRVRTQQDYNGWNPRSSKEWLQEFDFPEIPSDVFKQYDEMRMNLCDEVIQKLKDEIVDTHMDSLMKKVQPLDIQLLQLIEDRGPVYSLQVEKELGVEGREAITRLKSRQLVSPMRCGMNYYKYDITDLAIQLLKVIRLNKEKDSKISTFQV